MARGLKEVKHKCFLTRFARRLQFFSFDCCLILRSISHSPIIYEGKIRVWTHSRLCSRLRSLRREANDGGDYLCGRTQFNSIYCVCVCSGSASSLLLVLRCAALDDSANIARCTTATSKFVTISAQPEYQSLNLRLCLLLNQNHCRLRRRSHRPAGGNANLAANYASQGDGFF